ncbi:MAG: SLC13 family permease [Pseudomonadota bacterium]
MRSSKKAAAVLILIAAAIIYWLPLTGTLDREALRASALVVLAIGFWATGALPEHLTALLFLLLAVVSKVAPASVVFSGFNSSAAWLVFGGLVLASAVKKTGLGRRIAQGMLGSLAASYLSVISGIVLLSIIFAFFIPSTLGRVVLLIPVVTAMAERLGFSEKSPGHEGMVMAATLACYVPACAVLPAAVPNVVAAGAAESLYNLHFSYGQYLKLHFPVIGFLKALAIIILTMVLFPDKIRAMAPSRQKETAPFRNQERTLTIILCGTLLLWGSDVLHGISPAWVALGAAFICMLPFAGIFPDRDSIQAINFSPFFYVAGVLGMGAVVVKTGLGELVGRELIGLIGFEPGHVPRNFFSLVLFYTALGLVTTAPGVPVVMAPLSAELAAATGFPLMTVLMAQVIGFSTLLLPYQVPPVVIGMQLGRVSTGKGTRLTLALAAVSIFILMPVNYLWWALLGVFGR